MTKREFIRLVRSEGYKIIDIYQDSMKTKRIDIDKYISVGFVERPYIRIQARAYSWLVLLEMLHIQIPNKEMPRKRRVIW